MRPTFRPPATFRTLEKRRLATRRPHTYDAAGTNCSLQPNQLFANGFCSVRSRSVHSTASSFLAASAASTLKHARKCRVTSTPMGTGTGTGTAHSPARCKLLTPTWVAILGPEGSYGRDCGLGRWRGKGDFWGLGLVFLVARLLEPVSAPVLSPPSPQSRQSAISSTRGNLPNATLALALLTCRTRDSCRVLFLASSMCHSPLAGSRLSP